MVISTSQFLQCTFKLTILLIRFQITGPLYCADSFPTFYFTLASVELNPEKIRFERARCSALPTEVPSHQVIATLRSSCTRLADTVTSTSILQHITNGGQICATLDMLRPTQFLKYISLLCHVRLAIFKNFSRLISPLSRALACRKFCAVTWICSLRTQTYFRRK